MNKKLTKKVWIVAIMMIFISFNSYKASAQEKKADNSQLKIEVKQIEAQKALVVKTEAATKEVGQKMGEVFGKLFGYLGSNNINPAGPPFAVYYTFDPQGNTSFEVGAPVSSTVKGNNEVIYKEFPAMKVVSTLFVGPYEKMVPVYEQLEKYLKDNNLQSAGAPWEVYLTDPQQEKDPNKYQTIIYFPIK